MMKSIFHVIIFLLLVFTIFDNSLFSQTTAKEITGASKTTDDTLIVKNPSGAMLRSMLFPGWGQFYNGKWLKGIVVAGTEVGLVVNAAVLNQWAKESVTENERAYYIDNRNLSYWILGAVVLYSMADAYVDAALFDFDESPELSLDVKSQREPLIGFTSRSLKLNLAFPL